MTTLCILTALAGCTVAQRQGPPRPAAWVLVLHSPLEIPAASAHVTLQDGIPVGGADRYRPYCELEVNTRSERPQTLQADRFAVRKVAHRRLRDELAGIPAFGFFVFHCGEDVYYETRWWLGSETQPDIRSLTCREVFDGCRPGRFPGPAEIEQALGKAFSLQPAP